MVTMSILVVSYSLTFVNSVFLQRIFPSFLFHFVREKESQEVYPNHQSIEKWGSVVNNYRVFYFASIFLASGHCAHCTTPLGRSVYKTVDCLLSVFFSLFQAYIIISFATDKRFVVPFHAAPILNIFP